MKQGDKQASYCAYLIQKGQAPRTAAEREREIINFTRWLEENGKTIKAIDYEILKDYIAYNRERGLQPHTINEKIRNISYYLQYLKNDESPNIATTLRLQGVSRDVPHNLLSAKELDYIYENYESWTHHNTRPQGLEMAQIILGLTIYQRLGVIELQELEKGDILLNKGKIHIPGTRSSNERILELKPLQILQLHKYIEKQKEETLLFDSRQVKIILSRISKVVKRNYPKVKEWKQIRASVITCWLKQYNQREVQYMAGHRYVSSTERYNPENLENLQKELEKYHPLK